MPKIIIFGDIDITSLHISVGGCKELMFSGKYPRGIDIARGTHHIVATSMTKSDRKSLYNLSGDFMGTIKSKMIEGMNTSLAGQI